MNQDQIRKFLDSHIPKRDRTIVIIDYANVNNWRDSLGWVVGTRELATLAKKLSSKQPLRRFYYGSDYGPKQY